MCDASEGERSDAWESLFVPFGAGMYNSVWAVAKEKARAADGVLLFFFYGPIFNFVRK